MGRPPKKRLHSSEHAKALLEELVRRRAHRLYTEMSATGHAERAASPDGHP